ncbi:adenosylmethionine decarboxylase [Flavobacterium cauense R2A-7]|uniref:S-adenosylmethionine decarboxylase n=1 Tax=Flavobacterium cauense R2A-7 TaxID=1341154 RepID=V6S5N0_9FLAO|nr:S-adenosylmethionine decarboxylase [Flavobacterium cauense]ESU21719.1 adenosylmethionine decarboxylase [Flavobacterium cauense R2A-7]KGO80954.1 adenosylmethionine decarboxylase [Flavobacterium cauense R2A-7]TWI12868.1 S-adenosylmethionine decarboxylase [Flavobacterium cauense R2A-7]
MNSNSYSPGLHKLVTLQVDDINKLTNSKQFIVFTDAILEKFDLEKVGLVTHDFDNDSFTIAVCLKESHICIHTWPEFQQLTLDVYLCNYLQDNSAKVRAVVNDYIDYFSAVIIKDFEINR